MRRSDLLSLRWTDDGHPLIEPRGLSPVVADPSFLFPSETPDGLWALACHDAFGLRLYRSVDGLAWGKPARIAFHAMRPFLRRVEECYVLWYERYRPFGIALTLLPKAPRWESRLEVRTSLDLKTWSAPEPLIFPDTPWATNPVLGASVSNPCAISLEDGSWRLYCSAGLARIPDCGFDEPRYLALADGPGPLGPFVLRPEPLHDPADDGSQGYFGAGSMKVIRCEDGFIGFQNLIFKSADGKSRSAIFLLESEDGIRWKRAQSEPLLAPSTGWRRSHVYACDVRYSEATGLWYLYYNARDAWSKTEGRERIGRLEGRAP